MSAFATLNFGQIFLALDGLCLFLRSGAARAAERGTVPSGRIVWLRGMEKLHLDERLQLLVISRAGREGC